VRLYGRSFRILRKSEAALHDAMASHQAEIGRKKA
jgi:hypothetical protein